MRKSRPTSTAASFAAARAAAASAQVLAARPRLVVVERRGQVVAPHRPLPCTPLLQSPPAHATVYPGQAGRDRRIANVRMLVEMARRTSGIGGVTVVDWAALPLHEQLATAARHRLYIGMMGTSMFNAIWMPPSQSAALMVQGPAPPLNHTSRSAGDSIAHASTSPVDILVQVLACGCTTTSNFWALHRHGAPGTLHQYLPLRPVVIGGRSSALRLVSGRGPSTKMRPCDHCEMDSLVTVPPACIAKLLAVMVRLALRDRCLQPNSGSNDAGHAAPASCEQLGPSELDSVFVPTDSGKTCESVGPAHRG